ncbi:MAG: hypothetical protein JWM08_2117 [Candidatus Angelobacter sp.]|nr:hypothetical protein [Candidatus Angelobacter sp.]
MRLRSVVLFAFILAVTSATLAQDAGSPAPQPVPVPNSVVPTGSDPNDSGYTSQYLLNYDWTIAEDGADNAFLRLEANRQRRGGDSTFIGDMMFQAQQERALNPQLMPGVSGASGIPLWFNMGPLKSNHIQNGVLRTVTDSGRARTILPHPTDPNIVYFLTSSGGLWKTTNFQKNKPDWVALTDGVITTSGGAVAFGRTPDTIYLGLGDPFDGNAAAGAYVLKSTDGGRTWGPAVRLTLGGSSAASVRDLKVDTSGPVDVVLAATDFGLFRSANGGATFAFNFSSPFLYPTAIGTFAQTVWSIVNTSQGWVASTESPVVGIAATAATDGVGKLAVSTDRGATWQSLAALTETFPAPTGTIKAGRITLGVGSAGDASVYAFTATQRDGSQLDLFRSNDGGANWTPVGLRGKTPLNPNPDAPNLNVMGGQAFYNHMLLVDPNDANRNTVFIGGQLFSAKSVDGGTTWRVLADWLAQFKMPYVHADYHTAAISPVTKQVFFGSDGGLFVSNDGGATWDDGKNEGIVTELAYSIAVSPNNPLFTIIGTQDNGTFSRVANTDIWEQTLGGDGIGTAWSKAAVNNDVAFTSFPGGSTVVAANTPPNIQAKWAFARNGINRRFGNFFTTYASPSAAADTTGQVFYNYTSREIYRTTNAGGLWTDIGHTTIPGTTTPPTPATPPSPGIGAARIFRDTPHGIGVSPTPDGQNHVAVVCNGGFVVVTHNGGATWTQAALIGPVIPTWQGFNSNVEWADNTTLYVSSESPISGARVAKSTDGGLTFVNASTGLPNVPVARLVVSPVDKNTLYAATFLGVYRTINGGLSWSRFGAGLPFVEVDDIYIAPDASFLRVASFGRGVWEIHP